jgi:hypothetical protein
MKNIFLLPTDKPSRLLLSKRNNLQFLKDNSSTNSNNHFVGTYQNIYITNSEEIKEGDWFLQTTYEGVFKCSDAKIEYIYFDRDSYEPIAYCKKIILTTDQELIEDGVQPIDNEFLEWFVKNPSCERVDINRDWGYSKIIIPQKEPKQETLEEAQEQTALKYFNEQYRGSIADTKDSLEQSIKVFYDAFKAGQQWQAERMYSEEEALDLLENFNKHTLKLQELKLGNSFNVKEWFEQFKKK